MESRQAAAAAAPLPPPYPPALVSLPALARPPSSMTMSELEAVAAALPAKKRRLRETFDRLAASSPTPLPFRWEDLDTYLSSLQYSVTLRFRELRTSAPQAATGGNVVEVGEKRTAADEAMHMQETQEKTRKVDANAAAAIEKAPPIQGTDANGKKLSSQDPPGCGNGLAAGRTRTDATVQVDPVGKIAVVRQKQDRSAATRHPVNATDFVKASAPNSTSPGQDSPPRPVPVAVAVSAPAVTGGDVEEMREVKEDSAAAKNHSNEGGEAKATNATSVLPAKAPKQEEPSEEVAADVEMEIVDHGQKVDQGKSETIKKFEKPKPTFKKLLAKYKNGKVGQKVTSQPKNFKRPRSPPKQEFDHRDRRNESFHAAAMYPPFGPPVPVIWGPPPVGFPPCPSWGWYGPMMPPPVPFGHFHPGWTPQRMPLFDRLPRPKDSRFDQRSRFYDGKGNRVVKKIYRVKESSNESEKSDLNSKEKRPAIEQEVVQKQPANMDLVASTERHGANIAVSQKKAPKSARVAEPSKGSDMGKVKEKTSLPPGTHPQPRWCPLGLSHSQKRRLQRLRTDELKESKAEKVRD